MRNEDLKVLKKICRMNEETLHYFLCKKLKEYGYTCVDNQPMFIMAEGTSPICLCAHMDTVFTQPPQDIFYDFQHKVMWSPQGLGADDRAGIFIILKVLQAGLRPSIIFTHGEERGGKGADEIVKTYGDCPFLNCKALIQLDRQGGNDAVYYNCDNKAFEQRIMSYGFKTEWGTFSDISVLGPIWEVAAVNLSVGYIREHSVAETLYTEFLLRTFYKVCDMIHDSETKWCNYSYIPAKTYPGYFSLLFSDSPTEEDSEFPLEDDDEGEDYFYNRCLFCNRLIKPNEQHYRQDGFKICPECYNTYYGTTL